MWDWDSTQRLKQGIWWSLLLGAVAGAIEFAAQTASFRLSISLPSHALLGLVAVAGMALLTAMAAGIVGAILHPLLRSRQTSTAMATHLGVVGLGLTGFYFWHGAAEVLSQGRVGGALFLALFPFFLGFMVGYSVHFWMRRKTAGLRMPVPWWSVALGGASVVVLGTVVLYPTRYTGGSTGLPDDPNVLLITVDGLRADRVLGSEQPPTLRAWADRSVVFSQAVTPATHRTAAMVSLHTGLHPLSHGVLSERRFLQRGEPMALVLQREGYATAAFVSHEDLHARTGLNTGFYVYDDDFSAGLSGLNSLVVVRDLAGLLRGGQPASRAVSQTEARLLRWLGRHEDVPFFAWLHLSGPPADTATANAYDAWLADLDTHLASLEATLRDRGLWDQTMVVLTGSHGFALNERRFGVGAVGLADEVVRVPLFLMDPRLNASVTEVTAQVRLQDVHPTVLNLLDTAAKGESEGVVLVGYAQGTRRASLWTPLLGQWERDGRTHTLLGMRNRDVKYLREVESGAELLFALETDPQEHMPQNQAKPDILQKVRDIVAPDLLSLSKQTGIAPGTAGEDSSLEQVWTSK